MNSVRKRDYASMVQGTELPNQNSAQDISTNRLQMSGNLEKVEVEAQMEGDKTDCETDRLTALPSDVTLKIMQYLSQSDLYHCGLVCHGFAAVADDNQMWKPIWEDLVLKEPALNNKEPQQGVFYKLLCKGFAEAKIKWKTGEDTTIFTKNRLTTQVVRKFRRDCLAISNRYILAASPHTHVHSIFVFSTVDGKCSHELKGLPGSPGSVLNPALMISPLVLSQDGQKAAAYSGTEVCVWNVETGELLHSFHHLQAVCKMALHGKMLAVGFHGGVFLWDLDSGQCVHQFNGLEAATSLGYDMVLDDQHLAVYCKKNEVLQLCDAKLGSILFRLQLASKLVKILLDSASHSLVGLKNRAIYVCDTDTGRERRITPAWEEDRLYKSMVVQDEKLVVYSMDKTHRIVVIDLKDLKGNSTVGYSVNGPTVEPLCLAEIGGLPQPNARTRYRKIPTEYVMTLVSNGLIVVTSNEHHFMLVFDMKKREFVRNIAGDGAGEGHVVGISASFSKLQFVRKGPGSQITYVSHDFGAE